MDPKTLEEMVSILKEHAAITSDLHRRIAGMQFALLGIVGGAPDPARMIRSLELIKKAALPAANQTGNLALVKTAISEQIDMLIQHVKDVNDDQDGTP